MLVLVIFILAYGTASQALIHPQTEFAMSKIPQMLNNIIYLPYWQMYGELNLDQIESRHSVNIFIVLEMKY